MLKLQGRWQKGVMKACPMSRMKRTNLVKENTISPCSLFLSSRGGEGQTSEFTIYNKKG